MRSASVARVSSHRLRANSPRSTLPDASSSHSTNHAARSVCCSSPSAPRRHLRRPRRAWVEILVLRRRSSPPRARPARGTPRRSAAARARRRARGHRRPHPRAGARRDRRSDQDVSADSRPALPHGGHGLHRTYGAAASPRRAADRLAPPLPPCPLPRRCYHCATATTATTAIASAATAVRCGRGIRGATASHRLLKAATCSLATRSRTELSARSCSVERRRRSSSNWSRQLPAPAAPSSRPHSVTRYSKSTRVGRRCCHGMRWLQADMGDVLLGEGKKSQRERARQTTILTRAPRYPTPSRRVHPQG